jgi:hypothetical protein
MARVHKAQHASLDAEGWIRNVVDCLRAERSASLSSRVLYQRTDEIETAQTYSLLAEHPSIVLDSDDTLTFVPFLAARNRAELHAELCFRFPRPVRPIDLYGIYPYVMDDVELMIFEGHLQQIGNGVVACPAVRSDTVRVSEHVASLWRSLRSTFSELTEKQLADSKHGREGDVQGPSRGNKAARGHKRRL